MQTLDSEYERIGWWKGSNAEHITKEQIKKFWLDLQERGAVYLVRKTRSESNLDLISGIAFILSQMPSASLPSILTELERPGIEEEQAETLLKAISWMAPLEAALFADRLRVRISHYLNAASSDVRDAASAATRALPHDDAVDLLLTRRDNERDPAVRDALDFELEERGHAS